MTKRSYKVLRPIAYSGRHEAGEIIDMTPEDAQNIGAEFLMPVDPNPKDAALSQEEVNVSDEQAKSKGKGKGKGKSKKTDEEANVSDEVQASSEATDAANSQSEE